MEPWAKRIKQLLDEGRSRGLTQTGLAKACGRSQPSLSQWFNDSESKPATQMILGDNLVAAARYLGVTPEWIMTGSDSRVTGIPDSQPERLSATTIAETAKILGTVFGRQGVEFDPVEDADLFAEVYTLLDSMPSNPSQEETVGFTATVIDLVAKRLERSRGREASRYDRKSAGRKAG